MYPKDITIAQKVVKFIPMKSRLVTRIFLSNRVALTGIIMDEGTEQRHYIAES